MIEFGINFFGHLGSILGAKLGPCWHHFRLKWGGAVGCYPLLCCVASFILLFRGFDPVFAPSWLDFGASGPHLGGLLAPFLLFWCQVGAPLGHLDARMVLDVMKYSCLARRNARSGLNKHQTGMSLRSESFDR